MEYRPFQRYERGRAMNKIIGLITAWNAEIFIEPAIEQSVKFCDETLVTVAPHSDAMAKYKDDTLLKAGRLKEKYPQVKLFTEVEKSTHANAKAFALNRMIGNSDLFEPGNWIWILDVDEFYLDHEIDQIKKLLFSGNYNSIETNEKYFYINMKKYLKNTRPDRLRLIESDKNTFFHVNKWTGATNKRLKHEGEGVYHYGALLNPYAKVDFWNTEYGIKKDKKVSWIPEVYLKYNLNDEHKWLGRNFEIFGVYNPFLTGDFKAQEDGTLFTYDGKHPDVIEESGLTKYIEDFRKLYKP